MTKIKLDFIECARALSKKIFSECYDQMSPQRIIHHISTIKLKKFIMITRNLWVASSSKFIHYYNFFFVSKFINKNFVISYGNVKDI